MDNDFSSLQEIEEYLDGTLGPNERAAFEKRMQEDAALREEFEQVKTIIEALHEAALKQKLAGIHKKLFGGGHPSDS